MGNVVSIFDHRKPEITNEQKLKLFCIKGLADEQVADELLKVMTIDEAFSFLADKAEEWGLLKNNGRKEDGDGS